MTFPNTSFSRPPLDLPPNEFRKRTNLLMAWQCQQKLDNVLIVGDINRYYFTGLQTSNGVLLSNRKTGPSFYTDSRYLTMARQGAPWLPVHELWTPLQEADVLSGLGSSWRRVGFEGTLATKRFLPLQKALPQVDWVDLSQEIAAIRAVKSPAEQQAVRQAIAANDALFNDLLTQLHPGLSEWQIRTFVRQAADCYGQGEAFDTIACVGRYAAEPHHHPNETVLKRGQPLLLDLGLKLNHYCADMTRCVTFGSPSTLFRELHQIVLEANQQAVRAIRPGLPCHAIDAIARTHIANAGFGKYFTHSLGHGVGLEIHEGPTLSPTCATVLTPGMIVTVEPGIYLPGRLGIRIEDVVRVTQDGAEVLTQTPHTLTL